MARGEARREFDERMRKIVKLLCKGCIFRCTGNESQKTGVRTNLLVVDMYGYRRCKSLWGEDVIEAQQSRCVFHSPSSDNQLKVVRFISSRVRNGPDCGMHVG